MVLDDRLNDGREWFLEIWKATLLLRDSRMFERRVKRKMASPRSTRGSIIYPGLDRLTTAPRLDPAQSVTDSDEQRQQHETVAEPQRHPRCNPQITSRRVFR